MTTIERLLRQLDVAVQRGDKVAIFALSQRLRRELVR